MTEPKTGTQQPEHNPTLKIAALEITEILKKHDIAGVAVLHTVGFKEIIVRVNPTYSVIDINEFRQLKVNKPIEDPAAPDIAAKKIADTVNMIAHVQMSLSQLAQVMSQTLIAVRMSFGLMPKPGPPPPPPNFINGKKRK